MINVMSILHSKTRGECGAGVIFSEGALSCSWEEKRHLSSQQLSMNSWRHRTGVLISGYPPPQTPAGALTSVVACRRCCTKHLNLPSRSESSWAISSPKALT